MPLYLFSKQGKTIPCSDSRNKNDTIFTNLPLPFHTEGFNNLTSKSRKEDNSIEHKNVDSTGTLF